LFLRLKKKENTYEPAPRVEEKDLLAQLRSGGPFSILHWA
jgi:hypothetical protein